MTTKRCITIEGKEKLEKELFALREEKRPLVVEALSIARSAGDLSENNAYSAAREELDMVDARIDELEEILASSQLVKATKNGSKSVCLGSKVIVNNGTGQHEFCIVGEWEADPINKRISHSSPLGKALLDKETGDEVEVEAPAGKIVYKILEIN